MQSNLQKLRKTIERDEAELSNYCFQVTHAYCVAHDLTELEKKFDFETEPQLLDELYLQGAQQRVSELEALIAQTADPRDVNYKQSLTDRLELLKARIDFELSEEFVEFKREAFKLFLKNSKK